MFLEAHFGSTMTPIMKPRLPGSKSKMEPNGIKAEPGDDMMDEEEIAELEANELVRLGSVGLPVPGIEIKVDKYVAKIWLETLEVECASSVFAQRVKAVLDKAVETVAPVWATSRKQV
jgi:cleavage and polyadenylation specificity factor subunit 3